MPTWFENTENIGARRLHTILERLLDVISFEAPDRDGEQIMLDADYVNTHLDELAGDEDLSRYILWICDRAGRDPYLIC